MDLGAETYRIIRSLDRSENTDIGPHMRARAAGRFLEEAVELALAFGCTPRAIMGHIADALHNEARKASCFITEIPTDAEVAERIVELGDNTIMLDHLRHLAGVSRPVVEAAASLKVERMREWAETGQAKVIDGLFYRKAARP